MAERMSPLDAYFLYAEDDGVNHMHLGGFAVLDGAAPSNNEMLRLVASRLPLIPRYRQRVRFVPLHLGRPLWVDDSDFELGYHIRQTALPSPGGEAELRRLVERIMSQRLDRSRPLWELWVIEGLEGDRWAVAWKIHHCMIDGVSGTELLGVLFDQSAQPSPAVDDDWTPAAQPAPARLALDAAVDLMRSPYDQMRALRHAVGSPRTVARTALAGLATTVRVARPNTVANLNGTIGPNRRFAFTTFAVVDIKRVRQALGGTINDVLIAALVRGFRDLLASRGESADGRVVRALVPVALRSRDEGGVARGDGSLTNKVAGIIADLPIGTADPVERLRLVTEQLTHLKRSGEADAAAALIELSAFAPGPLFALGIRSLAGLPQRAVNTVITNVPGPQTTLYLAGRPLQHIWAYAPPFPIGTRAAIAIYSYNGDLHLSVTGDLATFPDVDVLVAGTEAGIRELMALTETPRRHRRHELTIS
jgi:diacylglycerol O-acyltransferase